jgi:hypothetical protein
MSSNIMQGIRNLLSQGKSSREVIQLGYAPGTVYKVQRQMKDGMGSTGDRLPSQERRRESHPERRALAEGLLTVLLDTGEGLMFAVWHPEPPVPCPACGEGVRHWDICLHCNRAVTDDCHCQPDSTACSGGFTFRELAKGLVA